MQRQTARRVDRDPQVLDLVQVEVAPGGHPGDRGTEYGRVIKQIKRVACGFRNQASYERRILLHIAAKNIARHHAQRGTPPSDSKSPHSSDTSAIPDQRLALVNTNADNAKLEEPLTHR